MMRRVLFRLLPGVLMVFGGILPTTAGTVFVDFATDENVTPPQGWNYSGIGKTDGHAAFNAMADTMSSPTYAHTVTNVSVLCKCSNQTATRLLRIIPLTVSSGGVVTNEDAAVTFENPNEDESVREASFDETVGANAFLIGMTGSGSGNWTLYSATVKHTGPEILVAPTGLQSEDVTSNSFTATWEAALAADSYALRVWQEMVGDPSFTTTAVLQNFDALTNANKTAKKIDDELVFRLGTDWDGTLVYVPARSEGIVQVGNGSSEGWLLTPAWTGPVMADPTLLVCARRYPHEKEGTRMPIDLVRGDTTNAVAEFTLTDVWTYYAAPLTDFAIGDRLLLHSLANGRGKRALIDSVQIVSGYVPGVVTTNEVFLKEGITETTQTVTNLQEGVYSWAVRADATDQGQLWSEVTTVSIEPAEDEEEEEAEKPEGPQSPTGLEATHVTSNSFSVVWAAVPGADGYLVTVTTNGITPAREGDTVWREGFPGLFQTSKADNIPLTSLNLSSEWKNWSGTNIFTCTTADSAVQLGNTKTLGTLSTGPLGLAGTGYALKLMAWRPSEGQNLPIEVMRGAETNLATDVALTKTAAEYVVVLPELAETDSLVLHSTTNASYGRVCLDDLSIVADYVPEFTTTVAVVDRHLTTDCAFSLDGLLETRVTVQVAAIVGGVTNVGEALEIDLAHSPAFGAWRTSTFANGMKEADFGFVADVTTSSTGWVNGVTIAGFHACKKGEDVTTIGRDDGNETTAGLYATSKAWADGSLDQSLSLLGSGSYDIALELHILNDHPVRKVLSGATIDFMAYQWTFTTNREGAMVEQRLSVDWAVTEDASARPADAAWQEVEKAGFDAGVRPEGAECRLEAKSFRTDDVSVPFGGMLWIRWRVGKMSYSPMFGVGDVRVRIAYRRESTVLFVR